MENSITAILEQLDDLINNCKLDEAEIYIEEQINLSLSNNRTDDAITLYNEQIGYFRDCGKFDAAIESCKRVLELIKNCNYENREKGKTLREIGERFGLTYDQVHDFFKRRNRKQREIDTGIVLKKKGRPPKDDKFTKTDRFLKRASA